jgi:hypothetical protein
MLAGDFNDASRRASEPRIERFVSRAELYQIRQTVFPSGLSEQVKRPTAKPRNSKNERRRFSNLRAAREGNMDTSSTKRGKRKPNQTGADFSVTT